MRSTRALHLHLLALTLPCILAGCGITPTPSSPIAGAALRGKAFGGQQPVSGGHIYLPPANATGYGQPSVSLLDPPIPLQTSDAIGSFVTTDSNGIFNITGD